MRTAFVGPRPTYRLLLRRLGRGPTLADRRPNSSAPGITGVRVRLHQAAGCCVYGEHHLKIRSEPYLQCQFIFSSNACHIRVTTSESSSFVPEAAGSKSVKPPQPGMTTMPLKDYHHGCRQLYHNARRVRALILVIRRRAGFDRRGGGATVLSFTRA